MKKMAGTCQKPLILEGKSCRRLRGPNSVAGGLSKEEVLMKMEMQICLPECRRTKDVLHGFA